MSIKNDVTYLLTRRQAAVGIFIYLFSCFWMFFLGVLIGRHTLPFEFSTLSFQRELTEIEMSQNKSVMEAGWKPPISAAKLDLFDDVKKQERAVSPAVEEKKNEKILSSEKTDSAVKTDEVKSAVLVDPGPMDEAPPLEAQMDAAKEKIALPEEGSLPSGEPGKEAGDKRDKKETEELLSLSEENEFLSGDFMQGAELSSDALILPEESRFTIQVASLKSSQSADRLVENLKDKGYPAYRAMRLIPEKGTWFRIRVGGFSSKEKAEKMYDQLKKELETQRILPLIMQQ